YILTIINPTQMNQSLRPNEVKIQRLIAHPLLMMLPLFVALACNDRPAGDTADTTETWAEKLGYPKEKKVLLLHMDDIGMCPEANAAAEHYIENGDLTSGAVMMPCPNAEAFIEWAKEHPDT